MNGKPTRTNLRLGLLSSRRVAEDNGVTNEELDELLADALSPDAPPQKKYPPRKGGPKRANIRKQRIRRIKKHCG